MNDRKALWSQLQRLMMHILKFMIQPLKRSRSWVLSIKSARKEINGILARRPSLKNTILEIWAVVFKKAKREAEKETGENCDIEELDWDTTFNQKFDLDDDPDNDDKPKK